ncbi:hypothetical protein HMPREF3144_01215 [Oligella sp. HMSC05A10]|uniref:siderophore-interacting protein n=1 Tax=Oligella sp. HMSC05A10 TaxID=1581112 RepID=UPI0008A5DB4E|nr:siderophore-interacting protein [Oligella sp. HMSC05A10]OFS89043.1 hypothetical protein HMPREF3144_01215 [Oligella sp. HMSC05A10]
MKRTAINNIDEKLDIIGHLNNEHSDDLLVIANYYGTQSPYQHTQVQDIYEEGVLLHVVTMNGIADEVFIEFSIKGTLEERILYLAFYAMTKQGLSLTGNKHKFFEVVQSSRVSKHMQRIEIKSAVPLPTYYAGYTYGFLLRRIEPSKQSHLQAKVQQFTNGTVSRGFFKRRLDAFLIWLLRVMSSKRRMQLIESMNRNLRLYTLRFAKADNDTGAVTHGAVDVYLHDNSAGNQWVHALKPGDMILSRTEVPERHEYLQTGRNVLIGDESAYPAIAGILELWQNPIPPTVLILLRDNADKAYFDEVSKPAATEMIFFTYEANQQAAPILDYLKTINALDGAWGGLEREEAKQIRHYLRHHLQLEGARNHVKAYWVAKDEGKKSSMLKVKEKRCLS